MKSWKPFSSVWKGGTAEISKFRGSRIKAKQDYNAMTYGGEMQSRSGTTLIKSGRIGLICNALPNGDVILGFPIDEKALLTTVDKLPFIAGGFVSIVFGVGAWNDLKYRFEVEI